MIIANNDKLYNYDKRNQKNQYSSEGKKVMYFFKKLHYDFEQ
jgi:hypothetical protein